MLLKVVRLLDNTGIRVCPRYFRNSSLFTVSCKILVFSMCVCYQPCAKRPDIFRKPITSLKQILASSVTFLINLFRVFMVQVFVPVFRFYCYFPPAIILFLLCMFSVEFSVFDGLE